MLKPVPIPYVPEVASTGFSEGHAPDLGSQDLSHDALALEMERCGWGDDARFVAIWGKWVFWDGARWLPDDTLQSMTRSRDFLRRQADKILAAADNRPKTEEAQKQIERAKNNAKVLKSKSSRDHSQRTWWYRQEYRCAPAGRCNRHW